MQVWHSAYGSTCDQVIDNKGSDSLENVQSPRDSPPDYDTGSLPKTPESPVKVAPFEASEGYDINIGDDFDTISRKIGVAAKLEKRNSVSRLNYRSYYNDETMAIVNKVYRRDIELFNYEFNGPITMVRSLEL